MNTAIPVDPDALLTREQTARALTEAGYPTTGKTLATKASRGGGPPFFKWGPKRMYRWRTSLDWAAGGLVGPFATTSHYREGQ
jgi:hypothetical protein